MDALSLALAGLLAITNIPADTSERAAKPVTAAHGQSVTDSAGKPVFSTGKAD